MDFHFCGRGQWVGCGLLHGELTGNVSGLRDLGTAECQCRPQWTGSGGQEMPRLETHVVMSTSVQGDVQRGSQPGRINKDSGPDGQRGSRVDHGHVKKHLPLQKEEARPSVRQPLPGGIQPCTATSSNFNKKKTEIQTFTRNLSFQRCEHLI